MKNKSLLLVPSGGLANRMRAIASAYTLCKEVSAALQVVWFRDWALDSSFHDIFEPIDASKLKLREPNLLDRIINDRPRPRNFGFFKLPQKVIYDNIIYEAQVTPLKKVDFDFHKWLNGKCYMSCYQEFGTFPDSLYNELFKPVKAVMEKVEKNTALFSDHTIGLHIRRTDNIQSIEESPTELFFDVVNKELAQFDQTKIFLATDSEEVKEEMKQKYKNRIITSDSKADRGSIDGIRDGLVDMWTLSRTARIYGSSGSSFSPMAAKIGGNELITVSKTNNNR